MQKTRILCYYFATVLMSIKYYRELQLNTTSLRSLYPSNESISQSARSRKWIVDRLLA